MPQYHPGDAIPSRCTRCNDVTGHVIVALVENQIIKVECRACGSVHKYRPPAGTPAAKKDAVQRVRRGTSRSDAIMAAREVSVPAVSKSKTSIAKAKAAEALEQEWQQALLLSTGQRAYSMTEKFVVDDVIDHPSFGSGIVKELVPPDKIRVLFRDGLRLLRAGG